MTKSKFLLISCLAMVINHVQMKAQTYANLPFIENFEIAWVNKDGTRDVPSAYWKNTPATGNNSWRRNDDGSSASWMGFFSSVDYRPSGSQNSQYSARFHSASTNLSGILDAYINFSTQIGNKTLSFWFINPSGNDNLEIYLSTDGGVTFGPVLLTKVTEKQWVKIILDLGNVTSSTGVIRFKATGDSDGLDLGLDDIRVSNPTEIPIDASFKSDKTSGQGPLTVNFIDQSGGTPTAWEWDFNNDGIVDATTQNPTYTYNSSGVYSVKLTAKNAKYSDVVINSNYMVVVGYTGLPYIETFENNWINRDDIRDVPNNFWKGTPSTGDNSWSREDDGMFRGAWNSDWGGYSPSGVNGSFHSASFNSRDSYNQSGSFDLFVNFSSLAGEKRLSFWYINRGGNDKLEVFLSTDGGATFGAALTTLGNSFFWEKVIVNLGNITSTNGVLRFKATTINDDSNIGIDDVNIGVPALLPLNAEFTQNKVLGSAPLTVNFVDLSEGAPTSWKWDFNNDGIVDATTQNTSYTYSSSGIYSVKLTVGKAGNDNIELKNSYIHVTGYSSLPFSESFENSWLNRDGIRDTPSGFVKNTPATGNNSWSKNDEGFSRGAWTSDYYYYTPSGANNSGHSAKFHSARTNSSGTLDFYLNFSAITGDKELRFWYINSSGTDKLEVFLSTDGGLTFGNALKTLTTSSEWTKNIINLGSSISSTCVLRFKATGDNGNSDIGIDEVKINAIEAEFTASLVSGPPLLQVSFTDQSIGNPTSWKWDFNNDGVIDATVKNPKYTYSSPGKYTVKLIASNAGSIDSILKTDYIVVKSNQYATLPYIESFDNEWINFDNIRDVPSNKWINNPATGYNSWSRVDDGINRGAWNFNYGSYTPTGANGSTYSARFHSSYTYETSNFDLHINLSTLAGDKALYFWYINESGTDNLEVLLSTNAGATFKSLTILETKSNWSKIALDLGNSSSTSGVIRFKTKGDNGGSDIGIDEVFVGAPSSTPIIPAFQSSSTSGMAPFNVDFTDQSTGDVTSWKWDFNGDGVFESTLQNPSYTYTNPGVYSVKLVASKGGMKDSIIKTNLVTITPTAFAPVPFREGFDKTWISRENARDVPSLYFRNNPSWGNSSWSRSDDYNRGWSPYRTISMNGSLGTPYAARFNSLGSNALSGTLDLYLDFSTQFGFQKLSFWYFNTSGIDKLEVYLSKDGGTTFGNVLQTLTTAANWTKVTIDLGLVNVSKGVIRFKATGDGGETNIGIDEIVVCDPSSTSISANFSSNVTSGNSPLTVNFVDQSVGTPSSWKWDFDNDGTIDATTQNPSKTYNAPGVYSVKMVAQNADSKDSTTKISYIVVPGYAKLPFSENFESDWINRDGFRDVPSYYYKNTPAAGDNSWSRFDDGQIRGAWITSNGGYYPSGANNSKYSARFHSYFSINPGILDLFVNFSTLSGDKTLSFWYINTSGDDSLNVYLSTDGGVTDGTLITTKKVVSSWTKLTVDLGNVTTNTGVIRFKASGDFGDFDIGVDEIFIGTTNAVAVDAKFTSNVTIGLVPLTVKFTNQSTGAPTSWKWDFNNDGIVDSTTQNPSYTFTKGGSYSVSLETSGNGTVDKETKMGYIAVYDKVEADFSANITEGFAPLAVYFIDNSTGDPTSWKWDFDNNGTTDATSQNPSYTFLQPGSYSVKLIISNTVSKDTIIKSFLIKVKGKATLPYTEKFDDDWKNYKGTRDIPSYNWINSPPQARYAWSREDDGVSRGAWNSNDAAYSPAGADGSLHSARFHTYDFMSGYLSSLSLNVDFSTLNGNKTLSFYYINPSGTDALKVYLSTNGGTSFGSALTTQTTSSAWTKVSVDLGNVTSANGIILFEVSADLDDTDIGIDELSIQTTGITPVAAQFTSNVTSGIIPLTVKFLDQSAGSPTSWKWDFNNDGIIDSTTQNPSFIFNKVGLYTVRLTSSKPGSTDTETKLNYIKVEEPVDAKFTVNKTLGIGPLTVSFTDQSTGSPTNWKWDFNNDGIVDATTQNPSYTFNSAGTYSVKLEVSKTNSTDTETKVSYITVTAPVVADFSANKTVGISPVTINFTDLSTGNPTSWSWDFNNDGTVDATTQNPSFTYSTSGTYTVKLIVSKNGSTDAETKTEYITVSSATGIPDNDIQISIEVYPNPASEKAYIRFAQNLEKEKVKVFLLDGNGKILKIIETENQDVYELDLTGYVPGVYFVKVVGKEDLLHKKLIKQ